MFRLRIYNRQTFHLQMSDSSESDPSNRPGCESDGEFSVASSYGSEVQDCRKRPRQPQIQGNSWVLRGQITMDQLYADSDSMAAGPEGDVENEDIITKINKPITDWDFNLKYKSVLIFYYFNKTITNYKDFDLVSNSIYELYQVRNLNHRGGKKTPKQVEVTGKIAESKSRYYFKFLGIFEDFVSKVNSQIN